MSGGRARRGAFPEPMHLPSSHRLSQERRTGVPSRKALGRAHWAGFTKARWWAGRHAQDQAVPVTGRAGPGCEPPKALFGSFVGDGNAVSNASPLTRWRSRRPGKRLLETRGSRVLSVTLKTSHERQGPVQSRRSV